jgi:hypothetical protein
MLSNAELLQAMVHHIPAPPQGRLCHALYVLLTHLMCVHLFSMSMQLAFFQSNQLAHAAK